MASLNKVQLIGHLGADPEIKSFQNGGRVANFRVATSESWKDKATGERKERTEWHQVAVTNDALVGVVERFVKKGSKVYLEGGLRTRKWQDQQGNDRYTTEITLAPFNGNLIMLDGANRQGGEGQGGGPRQGGGNDWGGGSAGGAGAGGGTRGGWDESQNGPGRGKGGFADDLDDDIPF